MKQSTARSRQTSFVIVEGSFGVIDVNDEAAPAAPANAFTAQEVQATSEVAKTIAESGLEMADRPIHTCDLLRKVTHSAAKSPSRPNATKRVARETAGVFAAWSLRTEPVPGWLRRRVRWRARRS